MAATNIMTAENHPFTLTVYDLEALKSALLKSMQTEDGMFEALLTDITKEFFRPLTNNETTSDTLTHICASGLTAKEVIGRIADIEDKELRMKLGASIKSFIVSKSSEELQKAFDIVYNFNELDDTKGDINVQEQTTKSKSNKRKLNVYYAKCLIIRKDNKYDLNVAFYDFVSTIPVYSISAYLKSKEDIHKELEIARAIAFNSLHRRLKAAWPDRIVLEE